MTSVLQQLFQGKLDLHREDYLHLPEYRQAAQRWNQLYDQLCAAMGQEFAETLMSAYGDTNDWYVVSWFKKGVRLGAQLMAEMAGPL